MELKKAYIILILVAGVLLVSGCISNRQLRQIPVTGGLPQIPTTTIKTAIISELSNCDNITDEIDKPWCYIHKAIQSNNSVICDLMSDSFEGKWINLCYWWVAKEKGDASECDKIDEKLDNYVDTPRCYLEVATKTRNASLCDLIPENYSIKYQCYLNLRDTVNKSIIDMIYSCENDSNCVPASCCHPRDCINQKYKPDCIGVGCSASCEPYTMDCCPTCGCKCENNRCNAILNNGTFS